MHVSRASLVAQTIKNLPIMQETWVQSPDWEEPLEKGKQLTPVFWPTVHGVANSRTRLSDFHFQLVHSCWCLVKASVSCSAVSDSATPGTVARQAPLCTEFSRQEYWSGLPFPSPGNLLDQGSSPGLLHWRQILYCLSHQRSWRLGQEQLVVFLTIL